jgi:chromosome partitioning protein
MSSDSIAAEVDAEIAQIAHLAQRGEMMVERLRKRAFLPDRRKTLTVRWGITEVAQLLGCSTNRIRLAEEDGRLSPPANGETGRRLGYNIEDLLKMREVLDASPHRGAGDDPAIIAVQNFKGGVGKSTITTHLAHYLAIEGYRVLVVDCDSQATTTTLFGFNPHFQIAQEQTLYPYLALEATQSDLAYAIHRTPWPNVDLIPSCLQLFDVEYELAAAGATGENVISARFRKLREGLRETGAAYDVVILDPPPALGTISLAVMQAATSLLVPLAATTPDFCSTVQFLSMMSQVLGQLREFGVETNYSFVRLLCSRHDVNDPSQMMVLKVMEEAFGASLLPNAVLDSAEISHAALRMMSVYELEKPIGSARTHKRCRTNMDEVMAQVEHLIRRPWNRVRPTLTEELTNVP